jgi:hypothetical protein
MKAAVTAITQQDLVLVVPAVARFAEQHVDVLWDA